MTEENKEGIEECAVFDTNFGVKFCICSYCKKRPYDKKTCPYFGNVWYVDDIKGLKDGYYRECTK